MHQEHSFFAEPRTWVAIAFVLFFVLVGRTLWRQATRILDGRADKVRAQLQEAERLRAEAEAALQEARRRREQATVDAQSLLEGARAEAQRIAAAAAKEAAASAARRERMALDRIAAAEKAAVDDVRTTAADIASAAAERVIRENMTEDADTVLIDHAIVSLPAALSAKRAA